MLGLLLLSVAASATPANRISLERHFGRLLPRRVDNCATCHQAAVQPKLDATLKDFPHNPFGDRLRVLGDELRKAGKRVDIGTRIPLVAKEDADKDGVDNLTELLLGHNPGDKLDKPTATEIGTAATVRAEYAKLQGSYRWQPFEPVRRPQVPKIKNLAWARNPIDCFVAAEHEARGLKPRPEAPKSVLLRRAYLDLIGLSPTPAELRAFEADKNPYAYERAVDRLLASPKYGERWGRHWMDVWRYSDWAGWGDQVRDSKPHIWRWRDWIIESLNKDKGYDRMVQEMLAADEIDPANTDTLRATGFLVRNYKLLSREQWMEDVVGHTSKAFLGVTMHCAKCHDHMYDPITSAEYYRLRAIFEPHNVRTLRVPGQPNVEKDGLVQAYDSDLKTTTYFYPRGDERNPDKTRPMEPGVPACLGGTLDIKPVKLPSTAVHPERREFEVREAIAEAESNLDACRKLLADPASDKAKRTLPELQVMAAGAEANREALSAILRAERLEDAGKRGTDEWKRAAETATLWQRRYDLAVAEQNRLATERQLAAAKEGKNDGKSGKPADPAELQKQLDASVKVVETAKKALESPPSTAYKPRVEASYPSESSGRRLAFAKWITDRSNPLAARVAVNHIWLRHFGIGLVPNPADFGRNNKESYNPRLIDWMAAQLMESGWRMKDLHRLIVTSATYRMDSRPDPAMAKKDPDNIYLWRMNSRRLEAEAVRDNVLWVSGGLDETMGGPEIDHRKGLESKRRSIYLRIAAEKDVEFLKIFDGANVTECYERKQTVMPQQALALANSELALQRSKELSDALEKQSGGDMEKFVEEAYVRVLSRTPTAEERKLCREFLKAPAPGEKVQTASVGATRVPPSPRAKQNLVLVLLNHHDFVTVR